MKPLTHLALTKGALSAIAFLTAIGTNSGEILAQSCLNCWINPQTGQEESLERIIPRQLPATPPASTVESSQPSPETATEKPEEGDKKEDSSPNPADIPIFDDPVGREESEPQPVPRTQVDPRLRYQQQERRLEENQ